MDSVLLPICSLIVTSTRAKLLRNIVVNVTKFIESMSKHYGNATHAIDVTAQESCRNCINIRFASVRIGW